MKFFLDYFPIIIFYIFYKIFDIYVACGAMIVACILQVIIDRIINKKINKMLLGLSALVLVFAGSTILLHDPEFIKWKVSVAYWVFAIVLLGSQFIGKINIIQRLMGDKITMPDNNWRNLNLSWVIFFAALGFINLYIIHHYSTNIWVNFKLFGTLGLTLVFVIAQVPFLVKYVNDNLSANDKKINDTQKEKEKEKP